MLEPTHQKRRLGTIPPLYEGRGIDSPLGRALFELAVERRQSLLTDLPLMGASDLGLEARTQPLGRKLLSRPSKAPCDVGAIHAQRPSLATRASDDDVRMRVLGIVMVDGCPLDGSTEVALDARHELSHVAREVELARVLRRHDEPKLMPLARS